MFRKLSASTRLQAAAPVPTYRPESMLLVRNAATGQRNPAPRPRRQSSGRRRGAADSPQLELELE